MSLLPDYSRQAERYDETRSASPSVLRPLREALGEASGQRLADIGGGTGNYALALKSEGWKTVVVDRSAAMLAHAAAKGLETVEADAQQLPFEDNSFDAAVMISMLHHVEDHRIALAEARRILRPGGRLALVGFTDEDAASLWILDYFPSSRRWMAATHPPRAAFLAELPGARSVRFEFEDMQDGSLAALSADPERVLEAAESGATSYFERMQRDHQQELRDGLARLRSDIAGGQAPHRSGSATLLSWRKMPRSDARIAPLPEALVAEAVALWEEAGLIRPWNDPVADCRRALLGPDSTVLATCDAAGVSATAMVGHDGHRGWVYYLAVAPRCRGRGLGRRLMEACEEWVSARGIPKIQLMVRGENTVVRSFYKHLGYELSDVVVLSRRLDGGSHPRSA